MKKKIASWIFFYLTTVQFIFSQTTTLITYDANGNRIRKQIVGSSPHPTVTANPAAVNPNQPSTLSASGCTGTVQWLPVNQNGSQINVSPAATTQYTAQCVVQGCANNGFAKTTVTVIQCPMVTLSAAVSTTPARYGQGVTLYAFGCNNGTVTWSSGQIGTPANIKIYGPSNTFTATCASPNCPNMGTASVTVAGVTGCLPGDVLVTLRAGNWNAVGTWVCGRIPTINDEVYLNHEVQVNVNGSAKGIILGGGYLNFPNSSFISLPQNPNN